MSIDQKIFIKLYNSGYSETEIAEYFKLTRGYIHNYKKKLEDEDLINVNKHDRELTKRREEYKDERFNEFKYNYYSKIKKEYLSGASVEEIQKHIHKRTENIQSIVNDINLNNKNYELHRKKLKEKLSKGQKVEPKKQIEQKENNKSIEKWINANYKYYGVLVLNKEVETYSNDGHYTDFLTYGISNNSELVKYAYDVRLNINNKTIQEYYFYNKSTNDYANPFDVIKIYAINPEVIINLLGLS